MGIRIGAGPEKIPVALLVGHIGGFLTPGKIKQVLLFRKLRHGGAHGASRTAAEELYVILHDQALCLSCRHIRFQFGIDQDKFHFFTQQAAALVNGLHRVLESLDIPFADILKSP